MTYRVALITVLALSTLSPSLAEELWQMRPFAATPEELLKASFTGAVPEGTNDIVLSEERSFTIDASGKRVFSLHRIYRVLTAAGVHGWDATEDRWEPWHENRPVLRARVITADGAVHELDPKTIAETPVDEDNEMYSDARTLKAPLPAVAAGSVVEEEITSTDKAAVMDGKLARRISFGWKVPVQHLSLSVEVPEATPLRFAAHMLPALETVRTEENGRIRVKFTQGPMAPVEETEDDLPFDMQRWPNVTFSTGASWSEVAAIYDKLVEAQLHGASVSGLLPRQTGKKLSKLELGNALLQKLHDEIRYTGVEFGEASFIPRTPAELLKRKFGDCKDQAALLVAMLRASGVPAQIALLASGMDLDTDPNFPGWGVFDHAIVYVPGTPAMWADPTSVFSRFDELPLSDRNRWALVVGEAGALVKTPEARPEENRVIETREFQLAEKGKAKVTDVTNLSGSIEVSYRHGYDGADPKETQKSLDKYAKDAYLSEKPTKYEYTKAYDLTTPFKLTIGITEAARGTSGDDEAVVAVPLSWLTTRLPEMLRSEVSDKTPKRKANLVIAEPYIEEWDYRIIPPPGFRPAPLPDSGAVKMGPATLTKDIKALSDGTIEARFRFDVGKRSYSAAEAEELRAAVLQLQSAPMLLVRYERIAQVLLKAGKIREALEESSRLIALHPKEALHHTQMAQALLAAGAAEPARKEARSATILEPNDPAAHAALGWILEHDLVGRRFQEGCDLAGAEKAYRKAVELDPEGVDARTDLAILLEHSPDGDRYASQEHLKRGIVEYRTLGGKLTGAYENNLLFALLRAGQFDEVRTEAAKKHNPSSDMLLLAAIAAKEGAQAAIAEAKKLVSDGASRRDALASAGQQLIHLRMYKQAAGLIEASAEGSDQAEATRARSQVLAKTERYEDFLKRVDGPATVVYQFFAKLYHTNGSGDALLDLFSADSPERSADARKRQARSVAMVRIQMARQGISMDTLTDLMFASSQLKLDGDEASAYRIRSEMLSVNGSFRFTAYVVREGGQFKVLDIDDVPALGGRALQALDRGDTAAARRLLDWAREKEQLAGGEDPLGGAAFPRFWTRGADPGADAIRYAAASLMARTGDVSKAAEILEAGLRSASGESDRLKFELALCEAYEKAKKYESVVRLAKELLRRYPLSERGLATTLSSLSKLKRWEEAERVIEERLKAAEDHDALRSASMIAMLRGDYDRVIEIEKKVVARGEANSQDLNSLAWAALCGKKLTPEMIEAAQNSVKMGKAEEFGPLHTLAAVYAETGKTTEAREIILHGMDAGGRLEPDSESWYVFGRIAEEYGLHETALADYRRVEKESEQLPSSTWELAQKRIATLARDDKSHD